MAAHAGHHHHGQLTRSLERILEDAQLSGELRLSGRKLRDFPKARKYQLGDTVVADLSKNRFTEVPDEVTGYYFLERLLLYHNVIRTVPDTIGMLHSLTYLDLSRNHLSEVPRDLCQLPLQVLLLSNNRLTSLPKEIGKMTQLTELDASVNQITQLPMTIGELLNLRALNLKSNQLGLLPLQITQLQLEILDISCNCISSLPIELRQMSNLVTLNIEHNPLVFPPTAVCVRGRIHIFKYLENQVNRDNLQKRGGDDPRRTVTIKTSQIANNLMSETLRHKHRYNVDSGYSTSDGGEKRWSSDGLAIGEETSTILGANGSGRSTPSTPSTISPGPNLSRATSLSAETPPVTPGLGGCRISPDGLFLNGDAKLTGSQQTYKQYKEALRKQQRQQDVYKPRSEQTSPPSITPTSTASYSTPHSPVANGYHKNIVSSNPSLASVGIQSSPTNTMSAHSTPKRFSPSQMNGDDSAAIKRPVQKVVPSRSNTTKNNISPIANGNSTIDYASLRYSQSDNNKNSPQEGYVKPISPVKGSSGYMTHNNVPVNKSNSLSRNFKASPTEPDGGDLANGSSKLGIPPRLNWNKDTPPDKLSFTMKREFDRAKEESELIQQLRSVIENRLKMTLPRDLAPILSDGVVLCHLANHVRPRSVASVHVPSATQPKLTMARCRRNVDNFLEACRKIGVEEGAVCQSHDILPPDDDDDGGAESSSYVRIAAIYKTVTSLLATRTHATDAHGTTDSIDKNGNDDCRNFTAIKNVHRSRYAEDRCISNFNTNTQAAEIQDCHIINYQNNNHKVSFESYNGDGTRLDDRVITSIGDRISYFNNRRSNMNLDIKNNLNTMQNQHHSNDEKTPQSNDVYISWFCSIFFISTIILLFIFPLPN